MALSGGWAKASRVLHTATGLQVFLALGALVLVTSVLYLVKHSRDAGLDHIPGPWLARYSNLHAWIEAQRWHGSDVCYLRRLHEKHGQVVRVAPRRVSVCDPDAIPTIYGMRASLDKSDLIRAAQPLGTGPDNLFSVREAKAHAPMRRAVANAYAVSTLAQYEVRIDDTLAIFFRLVNGEEKETNLGRWVHYYVYDVQGSMTFTEPLGYLENRNDAVGLIWQTKALLKYVQFTMPMPILHDIAAFVIRTVKAQNATVFHQLATRKVQERLLSEDQTTTTDQPNPDILSHFLRSRTKYPSLMTPEQITRHCMVNIVAGTGTSTSAIVNVLRYLVANPPAQARLYHELQQTTITPTTLPRWRDIQPLPFLEGLIREGIRLRFSDSFNPLARVVGASGMALPCGTRLPAGTLVGIKPSVASMQEKTFGPRPADFCPERWCREEGEGEEAYRERRGRMDRGDMSFGSGTRGCIGRGIALMQVYKVVAAVVARYELLPAEGGHREKSRFDFFCALQLREGEVA